MTTDSLLALPPEVRERIYALMFQKLEHPSALSVLYDISQNNELIKEFVNYGINNQRLFSVPFRPGKSVGEEPTSLPGMFIAFMTLWAVYSSELASNG